MTKALPVLLLALATAGLAGGCRQHEPAPGAEASSAAAGAPQSAPVEARLDAALATKPQFSTLAAAIRDTGLAGVLGGKASYTLFAPTDAAFAALGEKGESLRRPEQRAALAALLREHIVPGLLTSADLDKALTRSGGQQVKLRSMGKGTLSVSRDGAAVVVTGPDGARARLTGDSAVAKNGAALGIDGMLRKVG